jgi:hypothetical protein
VHPISRSAVVLALVVALGCNTSAVIDLFPAEERTETEATRSPASADDDMSVVSGSGGAGASGGTDGGFPDIDSGMTGGSDASGGTASGGATGGGAAGGAIGSGGSAGTGSSMGGVGGSGAGVRSLLHRYSFSEPGNIAYDSIGAAHGSLEGGAVIPATGDVVLDGVDDFVSLPSGLISPLHNATFMIWATWYGTTPWQRLWDFGNTLTTEDMRVQADRTFFLTPQQASEDYNGPAAYLEFRGLFQGIEFGHEYLIAQAEEPIAGNVGHAFTVVIDEDGFNMALFIDGVLVAERSLQVGDAGVPFLLSDIDDVNNALGRSQYAIDPYLAAEINEFRIYDRALSAGEVTMAYSAGADTNPVP